MHLTLLCYRRLVVVILIVIIDIIGSPFAVLAFLLTVRDRIRNDIGKRFARRWGVLFDPYKDSVYWWEVLALFRRSIFVALDTLLFSYNPVFKYLAFVFAHTIVFCAHMYKLPFKVPQDNTLESISLFILLILSLILMSYQYSQTFTLDALLFVLVAGPTLLFLTAIIITRTTRVANALIARSSTRESLAATRWPLFAAPADSTGSSLLALLSPRCPSPAFLADAVPHGCSPAVGAVRGLRAGRSQRGLEVVPGHMRVESSAMGGSFSPHSGPTTPTSGR